MSHRIFSSILPRRHVLSVSQSGVLLATLTFFLCHCQYQGTQLPSGNGDAPLTDDVTDPAPIPIGDGDDGDDFPDDDDSVEPILTLVETPFVEEVDATSVNVHFHTSDFTQANLEYGGAPNLDLATTREESFKFAEHRQRIRDLTPGTIYNYRIHATDQDGNQLVSDIFTFIKE